MNWDTRYLSGGLRRSVHVSKAQVSTVSRGPVSHSEAVTVEQIGQPLLPGCSSGEPLKDTQTHARKEINIPVFTLQKSKNVAFFVEFTVRCCMISCSRAALASSWLWSGVCCSSIDRICPSCGSSSSLRSPTRSNCRTIRSRRGTVLSANTQAPQIASLQVSDKDVLTLITGNSRAFNRHGKQEQLLLGSRL